MHYLYILALSGMEMLTLEKKNKVHTVSSMSSVSMERRPYSFPVDGTGYTCMPHREKIDQEREGRKVAIKSKK
jgi:hypothetical protein